jgi:hypothetical protein
VLAFIAADFVLYVPTPLSSGSDAVAAAFTPVVRAALLSGIAAALGVDASGIFIISITPYAYRRQRLLAFRPRSLYLPPAAGTGVTISTGIYSSAAATSPLVRAAIGGGTSDSASVMSAMIAVVQSQAASGAVAAAVAAQPAAVSGLGFSSPAQMAAQLSLGGTPVAKAPAAAATPSSGSGAAGGSTASIVAAVIVVLALVGAGAAYRFVYLPRSQVAQQPASPSAPSSLAAKAAHSDQEDAAGQAELQAQAAAVAAAQARVAADTAARAHAELHAVAQAQAQAAAQLNASAQAHADKVAATHHASAPPMLPGQVHYATGPSLSAPAATSFAGPSEVALLSGLSDADFVLDSDVSGYLDAHGLIDVLGGKTSRAPLPVRSLAEVCAADGRVFSPRAVRRLAVLGFIAPQKA